MKELARRLAYELTRKRVREENLEIREIRLERKDLRFFCLSTNPILIFRREGETWFFRECPDRLPAGPYWDRVCGRFFDSLDRLEVDKTLFPQEIPIRLDFGEGEIRAFRDYLREKRQDRAFRRALRNADRIARRVRFSVWEERTYDGAFFEAFHMEDLPEGCRDLGVYFLWNMRTAAGNFRLRNVARAGNYSCFGALRAAATQAAAELLRAEDLVTPVFWCRLTVEGEERFGTLSPAAPGGRMADRAAEPTPALQRELSRLNLLAVVCRQTDHGPNNYNIWTDENGNCRVRAFDNDNPQTFFPAPSIGGALAGCTPWADGKGRVLRPGVDRRLAERLKELRYKDLRRALRPYLNGLQIAAVNGRVCRMNRAIARTAEQTPGFLKDETRWDEDSLAEEMSGRYGRTYLTRAAGPRKERERE